MRIIKNKIDFEMFAIVRREKLSLIIISKQRTLTEKSVGVFMFMGMVGLETAPPHQALCLDDEAL